MNKHKDGRPGLHSAAVFELLDGMRLGDMLDIYRGLRQQAVESGLASPFLSNFGEISTTGLRFWKTYVSSAYMVPPIMFSPGFMLGVSTYADTLTLAAGVYESTVQAEDVERFFDVMAGELGSLESNR